MAVWFAFLIDLLLHIFQNVIIAHLILTMFLWYRLGMEGHYLEIRKSRSCYSFLMYDWGLCAMVMLYLEKC
jgi:hypothetical protein